MKPYTKPKFFEQIGRTMLARLLERYQPEFAAENVVLPDPNLEDREYYTALSRLSARKPGFPEHFVELLYSVEALSNAEGKSRLLRAVEQTGLQIERIQTATFADIAVQVLLADAALFALKHDETRIAAMSTFEYHGCAEAIDRRATFTLPTAEEVGRIKADFDSWLGDERDGEERVTEIEMHEMDGEFSFLIRRGDSFLRLPTVDGNGFSVRHLRPARDVVVVFNPERDELRIHAKTVREKRKLRQLFGERLFGDPDHFAVRKEFTLKPLREDGPEALRVEPGQGIDRMVLVELHVWSDDDFDACERTTALDLFAYAEAKGREAIPRRGRLMMAGFEVYFTGQPKPRMVYVREGNKLRLTRHCDAAAVHRWLTANGFRSPEEPETNRLGSRNGIAVGNR
jgi:hypothetical protein